MPDGGILNNAKTRVFVTHRRLPIAHVVAQDSMERLNNDGDHKSLLKEAPMLNTI